MFVTITIVKVKGFAKWAQRCTPIDNPNQPRYRGYYYKKDAVNGLQEWDTTKDMGRNYWHNFHSAKELHIHDEV